MQGGLQRLAAALAERPGANWRPGSVVGHGFRSLTLAASGAGGPVFAPVAGAWHPDTP
jgi:hypothetical protein